MYLTFKAKITTDKKKEAILNNICFSATKLYNTVNYYLRSEWKQSRAEYEMNRKQYKNYEHHFGYDLLPYQWSSAVKAPRDAPARWKDPPVKPKIPLNRVKLQRMFKDNHWTKNMHSQSAQFIVGEVINAYKSWFGHRKNGNKNANPPGFRPKTNLSPVTFVQSAPALESKKGNTYLRLSLGTKRTDGLKETTIKITHRKPLPSFDKLKNVRITYDTVTGNYYAHLVFDVEVKTKQQPQLFPTDVVAIDLGLNNIITATFSDGTSHISSGRELKAIRRYWQKVRAKVKPPSQTKRKPSRRYLQISRKESRQIRHRLHIISKQFVELCKKQRSPTIHPGGTTSSYRKPQPTPVNAVVQPPFVYEGSPLAYGEEKGVTHIVLGDLNGIRDNINYSKRLNQQLHNWNFAQLIDFIKYKAKRIGITVELISEKYTSQTCCKCGIVKKSNRKTRGLYICNCGNRINADRNGANNILTRYLRNRSSGSVFASLTDAWRIRWAYGHCP